MYITSYIVTGKGYFPLDMLRYDCSFPADSSAVTLIDYHEREMRSLKLMSFHAHKSVGITVERWNSFGWAVKIISTNKV